MCCAFCGAGRREGGAPRPRNGRAAGNWLAQGVLSILLQVILDNSRSNYAQLLAAQTLLKLVNENTLRCGAANGAQGLRQRQLLGSVHLGGCSGTNDFVGADAAAV